MKTPSDFTYFTFHCEFYSEMKCEMVQSFHCEITFPGRQIPDLTSLTSRLSETSTGAGLSRHDDVERTSVMLAIVATMCGLDICNVSHHRCASVGFGWHRRDTSGIQRCTGPL